MVSVTYLRNMPLSSSAHVIASPTASAPEEAARGQGAHTNALSTSEVKNAEPVRAGTGEVLDGVLGVGHQPDDVAALVGDAGDVAVRAVGVVVEVARDDEALAVEPVERRLVGDEAAFTVLEHDGDLLVAA